MGNLLDLPPFEIHLWYVFPEQIQEVSLLNTYLSLLNSEERQKRIRFRFAQHQHQYLVTRALIRSVLSYYYPKKPEDWQFTQNSYGKPEIVRDTDMPDLQFNLSHTEGVILCGIGLGRAIGVDVECETRNRDLEGIARRFFSSQESESLLKIVDPKLLRKRFLEYWVLKEAYVKARGLGLSLSLKEFSFEIEGEGSSLRLKFQGEQAQQWQFWLFEPRPNHYGAVFLWAGDLPLYRIVMRQVIPLIGEQEVMWNCLGQSHF